MSRPSFTMATYDDNPNGHAPAGTLVRRAAIGAAVVASACLLCGLFLGRVVRWHCFREVSQYALPPGTVVYEDRPAEARRLLRNWRDYREAVPGTGAPVVLPHGCWNWLRRGQDYIPAVNAAVVFSHELVGRGGHRSVVVIMHCPSPSTPGSASAFSIHVYGPELVNGRLRGVGGSHGPAGLHLGAGVPRALTIYAFQLDPSDRSRFTIPYTLNGQNGRIRGNLDQYGTGVELQFDH